MPFEPDPLRDHFIQGARSLLNRAYASPGTWARTRLADPDGSAESWCRSMGINPWGPDNVSAQGGRSGGLNARTRWMRAFVRCLYEQHLWWSEPGGQWRDFRRTAKRDGAIRIEVGRALPTRGIIPGGREVSVMLAAAGAAPLRAVQRKPDDGRIFANSGAPAGRWSDPDRRDW